MKTKTAAATVLVALLALGWVWLATQGAPPPAAAASGGGVTEDDAAAEARLAPADGPAGTATPEEAPAPASAEAAPAAGLRGRVVDSAGQPIAGASVFVFGMPGGRFQRELRKQVVETSSAADGSFAFPPPEEDTCGVYAEAAGFASRGEPWLVTSATSQDVEVVLVPVAQISGRVLGPGGTPLAGAIVTLARPESMSPSMREWRRLQTRTETAADGGYALERLPPGEVEIAATHASAAAESIVLTLAVGEHLRGVDFELSEGFSVAGTVVDERGVPVAGAEVATGDRESRRTAVTDTEGRFRVRGLGAGQVRLTASRPGYGARAGGYPPGVAAEPGDEDVRIVLFRAVRLTGLVRDAEGAPVEGAVVKAGPGLRGNPGAAGLSWMGNEEIYWTRSQAGGAFELEGLPPGELDLVATHENHEPSEFVTLTIALGDEPAPVELVLAAGEQISGRVQDEAGRPVAGVGVWMSSAETSSLGRSASGFRLAGVSGEDGGFTIGGLSPTGLYAFEARGDGWISPGSRDVQVAPGADDVVLVVRQGGVVAGCLLAPDGARRGGQVRLVEVSAGGGWGGGNIRLFQAQEMTRAETGFNFTGVPAGTYTLVGDRDGDLLVEPQTIVLADGEHREGIELRYAAGGSVEGRVTDEQGNPVAGVVIHVGSPDPGSQLLQLPRATTADDGTFSVSPLPAGDYWLSPGVPAGFVRQESREVSTGGYVEIVLSRGLTLVGRVLLPGGAPATSMQLRAFAADKRIPLPPSGITTHDGRFELTGVTPESNRLSVEVAGCASLEVELTGLPASGRHDLGDIRLASGARLALTVVDTEGRPASGATVMALEPELLRRVEPLGAGATGADGVVTLEHLRAGAVTLMVDAGDAGTKTAAASLVDGETSELRVVLPPTVVLSGRVLEADGSPRAGIHVQTQEQPEAGEDVTVLQSRETVTASDGTYRIVGMVAGRHMVSAHPDGRYTRAAAQQSVTVEPPAGVTCDLSLSTR